MTKNIEYANPNFLIRQHGRPLRFVLMFIPTPNPGRPLRLGPGAYPHAQSSWRIKKFGFEDCVVLLCFLIYFDDFEHLPAFFASSSSLPPPE